jgi:hypothetical protein
MTVLAAVQSAAPWIGITVPTVLFTATDRTSVEMQAMVNEAALGICEDFDWQRLKTLNTITGDGSDTDFDLPSDYARMPKDARLWPSDEPNSPLLHVLSDDDWLGYEVQDFDSVTNRWIIYGGALHIKPAIANLATVKHFYISNKIVSVDGSSTLTKTEFTLDTDSFFLGDRILKLAIIWRWKAAKGRPYAQDEDNYNKLRDELAGGDKGARILHLGKRRIPSDVTLAYPQAIVP